MITQQHGDEPLGTEAALPVLRQASAPRAAALREQLPLLVMPRINPDGWERYQQPDWEAGIDPRRNDNNFDLIRLYGPGKPGPDSPAPEAFAVNEVVRQTAPDLVLDYHHQVSYTTVTSLPCRCYGPPPTALRSRPGLAKTARSNRSGRTRRRWPVWAWRRPWATTRSSSPGCPQPRQILIGHSFGGLFLQVLLDRGYGSAGG